MSKPKASASSIRNLLQKEKQRFEKSEKLRFDELRGQTQEHQYTQHFPRLLAQGTFFTPHLTSKPLNTPSDRLVHQYAVVLNMNGKPCVSRTPYNPARRTNSKGDVTWQQSPQVSALIHQLEKEGYQFSGTNKDILVYERVYSEKFSGRSRALKSAAILVSGVTALTLALFIGEYLL